MPTLLRIISPTKIIRSNAAPAMISAALLRRVWKRGMGVRAPCSEFHFDPGARTEAPEVHDGIGQDVDRQRQPGAAEAPMEGDPEQVREGQKDDPVGEHLD